MIERHELTALAKSMGNVVRAVVEPLSVEVRALRAECTRLTQAMPAAGRDGRDADPETIRSMVHEAVAALPPAPAGAPGRDADMDFIFTKVCEEVQKAVAAIPPPAPGPAGPAGRDADSVDVAGIRSELLTSLKAELEQSVDSTTTMLIDLVKQQQGPAGPAGRDGQSVDVAGLRSELLTSLRSDLEENAATMLSTLTESVKSLQGPAGPVGPAGRDADPVDMAVVKVELKSMVSAEWAEVSKLTEKWKDEMLALINERAVAGPQGPAGKQGEPVSIETVRQLVLEQTEKRISEISDLISNTVKAQVATAVAAIPTPQPGKDGEPGLPGKDAEPIHPDTVRLMVVDAVKAAVAEIPKPADGEKGDAGRDAVELDILSSLQEGKVYPRGTFAYHLGGIVRAFRATDAFHEAEPLAKQGWEVVVEGLHSWNVDQSADLRSFTVSAQTTSGRIHVSNFSLPALIYREVYELGRVYERGDVVTYGGHAWHCAVEKTAQKPGIGKDWRLMVKEGRQGKPGPAGPAGKDGKDGRDGQDLTQMGYDGGKH